MKRTYWIMAVIVAILASQQIADARSRTISASRDANGNQHLGTIAVQGAATVTCLTATQSEPVHPGDPAPRCFVTGPGIGGIAVEKNHNVGTSGAGTVTLDCNGTGALTCSARIDD